MVITFNVWENKGKLTFTISIKWLKICYRFVMQIQNRTGTVQLSYVYEEKNPCF